MTKRPAFLEQSHDNGNTIVAAFRQLPLAEAVEVDRWLMAVGGIHGRTWQEDCLFNWISEFEDLEAAFGAAA